MPLLRTPSFKQKKFAQEYIKHGNAKKAAQTAYPAAKETTAMTIGSQNLQKPAVLTYMRKLMDKAGLTDEKIALKLDAVIEAGTTKSALKTATPKDSLKALEMSAKLKDLYPAERKQIETKSASVNLDLKGKTQDDLKGMLTDLQKEIQDFQKMMIKQK